MTPPAVLAPSVAMERLEQKWRDEAIDSGRNGDYLIAATISDCADELATLRASLAQQEEAVAIVPNGSDRTVYLKNPLPAGTKLFAHPAAVDEAAQQGEAVKYQRIFDAIAAATKSGGSGNVGVSVIDFLDSLGVDAIYTHPAAVDAEEVARIAAHIGNAVEYIEKTYPGTRFLAAGPILRNMRRWHTKLTAALLPATSGETP